MHDRYLPIFEYETDLVDGVFSTIMLPYTGYGMARDFQFSTMDFQTCCNRNTT